MNSNDYHIANLSETEQEKLASLEKELGKILIAWEGEQSVQN
ncbi:hypothetical protein GCM10010954_10310 [Halobacillus andaensis]|uniref:Uncharacterized protein n=1 Tax=Halobacillus andaensis TaxID=1176239 RepID=A0A917EW23_HALAA|nr:hypothetical protein [Halobacillus andaensis]MBP2003823.1 hypothetical protein [Halobacillus andaensis]GGF13519.1 hypothetical protein GCM10010954_10310 [Halobacillus andaensis]